MTNCETCRWFDGSPDLLGHCHKNPPRIFGNPDGEYMSDFPVVDPEDWCGQWKERIDVPSKNAPSRDQID